jgi:hypothetical protein
MKFRIMTRILPLCMFVALATSVQLSAQKREPKLTEFDAPGAGSVFSSTAACQPSCGTEALANNAEGAITGFYTDVNTVFHGFLRAPNGPIVPFDAPFAGMGSGLGQGTVAYSINDLGVIAGLVQDSSYVYHGFVRYADGSFKTFDAPGAGTASSTECAPFCGTFALDINLEGTTAGYYIDENGIQHGFVRSRFGEITSFDPTGSTFTFVCEETCLNLEGATTGYYSDASGNLHGFVRQPGGKITSFDAPGADGLTIAGSINLEGTITGYFEDSKLVFHGFVRQPNGSFETVDAPGAGTGNCPGPPPTPCQGTAAFSINLFGTITGEFLDSSSVQHGFSRSPDGTYTNFDAPDGGTGMFQGTRPSTNNLEGAVAGWYVDSADLNHGFVWIPGDVF